MNRRYPFAFLLALTACGQLSFGARPDEMRPTAPIGLRPEARPLSATAPRPGPGARTAQALDTTTAQQKATALATPPVAGARKLGTTIVTLGLVTEPGFWLRSSLVRAGGPGRAETAGGAAIKVDLIPGTGAAQLSLAAFRALNLPLTGLPEVTVFAD